MPASKPTLALTTPVSACFPAEALRSAASARTPHSAPWRDSLMSAGLPSAGLPSAGLISPAMAAIKSEDAYVKTPITPPVAYMDFLKMATSPAVASPNCMASPAAMQSPPLTAPCKVSLSRTATATSTTSVKSTASTASDDSADAADGEEKELDSAPTTATSEGTECSCDCDRERVHKSPKGAANANSSVPAAPGPFPPHPMSAPATGTDTFPSLKIPPSPAVSNTGETPVMSPFSARSVRSPFDWDAALKARRFADGGKNGTHHSCGKSSGQRSVRHIREVVTRTVTYTPRMEPAPKGKRRKVE